MVGINEQLEDSLENSLHYEAESVRKQLTYLTEEVQRQTKNLFTNSSITDLKERSEIFQKLLSEFSSHPAINSLSIRDKDNIPLSPLKSAKNSILKIEREETSLTTGKESITLTPAKQLQLQMPLKHHQTIVGTLVIDINLAAIINHYFIKNDNHYLRIYANNKILIEKNLQPEISYFYRTINLNGEGISEIISNLELRLELGVPRWIYFRPMINMLGGIFLLGIILIGITIFFVSRFANNLIAPLLTLRQRIEIADGEHHCCYPLGTYDEIDEIAHIFDLRTRELFLIQKELESRVDERTKELDRQHQQLQWTNKALNRNKQRLEQAQNISHIGNWEWTPGNPKMLWSDEVYRIFGYEPRTIPSSLAQLESMLLSEDLNSFREFIQSLSRDKGPEFECQKRFLLSDQNTIYVQINARLLPSVENQRPLVQGTFLNISSRVRAEEEIQKARHIAEEANRAKSMFLANMSHEIRTPLNALVNLSRLLLNTELNEQQLDYLDKVVRSSDSLLGIINDILDFSKIEAGKVELENVSFSSEGLVDDLKHLVGALARKNQIEMLFDIDARTPPTLIGDPLRLRQILTNLINNSIKFTEKGEILFSIDLLVLGQQQATLLFTVCDSGIGMSQKEQDRLFQPFQQADGTITRRYGGTGLGLTISQRLLKLMDSRLYLESTPHSGSNFSFTLEIPYQHEKTDEAIVYQNIENLKVLIVDDNRTARQILYDMLLPLKANSVTVSSGAECIEAIANASAAGDPFQLLLLDYQMPDRNGLDIYSQIVDQGDPPRTIMITAYGDNELSKKAIGMGIEHVIDKPVSQRLLTRLIEGINSEESRDIYSIQHLHAIPQFENAHVLVVEDNAINQQIIEELLSNTGIAVHIAENGTEALKRLNERHFDLVLMDLQMPEMDGYEATQHIRKQRQHQSLPIIAMTAHALVEERQRCLDIGMNAHISKPIDVDELYNHLAEWLAEKVTTTLKVPTSVPQNREMVLAREILSEINIELGLKRTGGHWPLYLQLLNRFHDSYREHPQLIFDMAQQGRFEELTSLIHTLKGVSGNLGAQRLNQLCQTSEEKLIVHKVKNLESWQPLLKHLTQVNQQINNLLEQFQPQNTTANSQPSHPEEIHEIVLQLFPLLESDLGEAQALLKELRQKLSSEPEQSLGEKLHRSLTNYDTDQAQEILKELSTKLNIKP